MREEGQQKVGNRGETRMVRLSARRRRDALEWGDFDLKRREVRVARAASASGAIDTPKSGHGRSVDLSASVCELVGGGRPMIRKRPWLSGESLGRYVFSAAKGAGEPMPHVTAQKGCKAP